MELFERLLQLNPDLLRIWVNGLEGTRKTSLVLTIWEEFYGDYELILIPPISLDAETLYHAVMTSPASKVFVMLDDLSYLFHHSSSEFRRLAQLIVTIRHWSKKQKIVIAMISHYARAVPPLLRQAHLVAFTSMASVEEFWAAARYFPLSYVLEFQKRWRDTMDYFLVNALGEVEIARLPPYRRPPAEAFSWVKRVKQVKARKQEQRQDGDGHNSLTVLYRTMEEVS